MNLKEATHDSHERAEANAFTKLLITGNITEKVYFDYLYNQYSAYNKLEHLCKQKGLLDDLPGIERTQSIGKDLDELTVLLGEIPPIKEYQSTRNYLDHLDTLDNQGLLAHLYVRHMGDMYGGQMIRKVIPGAGLMYEFEDRSELIKALRNKLSDDLATEANVCFNLIINLFTELANEHNIQ